jgi:lipopolysaccharide biosynthesis glycosyltransferase
VAALSSNTPWIPVLFACDLNYAQHTAACIASLSQCNPTMNFDIIVAGTEDFAPIADKFRRSFAGNPRLKVRLRLFDIPSSLSFPLPNQLTQETYIRFWIGDLFAEYDRAFYLDPDTVVLGSIAEFWNVDLGGRTVAAVPIPGSTKPAYHGLPAGTQWFNAGVMLFDLAAWRARRYCEICLDFLRAHPEKATDGDQDILNICLANDWLSLPFKWNVISPFYYLSHDLRMPPEEIEAVRRDARIVHFNGSSKPWSYFSIHPRRSEYWKNLRQTDWRDARPTDRTWPNVARKWLASALPKPVKQAIKSIAR